MNPEEGDLRPQLLDRFAFSVQIEGLEDTDDRVAIIERRIAFEVDPEGFAYQWAERERELSERISQARDQVNEVRYSRRDLLSIAGLVSSLNVDGHRADLVILRGAQAHAALQGRDRVSDEDIVLAAELALPHRIRGRLFQDKVLSASDLSERLDEVQGEMGISDSPDYEPEAEETAAAGKKKP
jgi:Mg-chelatase subunit ChlI